MHDRRALSLYLPNWPTDLSKRRRARCGEPPESLARPVLLRQTDRGRHVVAAACPRAQSRGVRPGMSLAHARALLGKGVFVDELTPQRDRQALTALAHWATRFTPIAAPDPPDGLLLDIAGCQRLFRGEHRLVARLMAALRRLGLRARAAVAPTFAAAWALARFADDDVLVLDPSCSIRDVIAPLPVEALRIEETASRSLRELGVERIGQLIDLPRRSLPSRFDDELLLRLDRALGQAVETLEPVHTLAPLVAERSFAGPVRQLEAILLVGQQLTDRLCESLEARALGAAHLRLTLVRSDAPPISEELPLAQASREPGHLWKLLRPVLDKMNMGFGVEKMTLGAPRTAPLRHEQATQPWGEQAISPHLHRQHGQMLDALVARLSPQRVLRAAPVASHLPERARRLSPVTEPAPPAPSDGPAVTGDDRPSILFDRPEPARVMAMTPDGPITRLDWRGQGHEITACVGPQRIALPWWNAATNNKNAGDDPGLFELDSLRRFAIGAVDGRDYFRAQDTRGRWLWVYRELLTGRWFVHGLWA